MKDNRSLVKASISIFLAAICLMLSLSRLAAQDSPPSTNITSLSWSPDGHLLAVGGAIEGQLAIQLYGSDGSLTSQIDVEGGVFSLAWSPDSSKLAAVIGGNPDTIHIWDIASRQTLVAIPQEGGTSTYALDWNPDGVRLASVRTFLNIWDTSTAERVTTLRTDSVNIDSVEAFAWYPDGRQIATVDSEQVLRVWDVDAGTISQQVQMTSFIVSIAPSPDGTQLALGGSDGSVQIVDSTDIDTVVTSFQGPSDALWYLSWAPQGDQLAVAGSRSDVTVWDVATGENVDTIAKATPGFLEAMEYSPYGGRLAYSTNPGSIGAPPVEPQTLAQRTYSANILNGAIQLVVPAPSLERLRAIGQQCNVPQNVMRTLNTPEQLPAFVTQVQALGEAQIPPGCADDMIAVVEALQASSYSREELRIKSPRFRPRACDYLRVSRR